MCQYLIVGKELFLLEYMCVSLDAGLHHLTVSQDVFFKIKEVISILRAKMVRLHNLVKKSSRLPKLTTTFGNAWGNSLVSGVCKQFLSTPVLAVGALEWNIFLI
jgi:hypothetical protein